MSTLLYDIEADGLLMDATRIWCIVAKDLETGEVFRYGPDEILQGYQKLLSADRLIGHNVRMYDDRVLFRLGGDVRHPYGRPLSPDFPASVDTVLLSRLVYPDQYNNPIGGHSLEDWGNFLGYPKQDFTDFSCWTPEMLDYCENDVEVTERIYKYLLPKAAPLGYATKLEHRVASIITLQVENGVEYFPDRTDDLTRDIQAQRAAAMDDLSSVPPWVSVASLSRPKFYWDPESKKTFKRKGDAPTGLRKALRDGPPQYRVDVTEFNPNSGDHIARLFIEKYGWEPTKRTEKGKVVTDEKVIESLDYPEAKAIAKVRLCDKRLSQIKQWNTLARGTRIHGDLITNGAVSGRMTHSKPNMAQVPRVGSPWGEECRRCFGPRPGWVQVGCDAAGLELRMLAHYMAEYDEGAYGEIILNSDIHTANQKAAGLATRDQAKTFIYGFLYGAGNAKIGQIVNGTMEEGKKLKAKFLRSLPALKKLIKNVKQQVNTKDYLVGLDGRHLPVRSDHMALNTLLQSAGAVVMKQALLEFYGACSEQFGPHGQRWALLLNVHDEYQAECEPAIAEDVGRLAEEAIRKAGEFFDLRIRLDGEAKVGPDWQSTH